MKTKHFYTHLIDFSSLYIELEKLGVEAHEKEELMSLAESNTHHAILDAILSELSEEDKNKFMEHLHSDNHDEIWSLLNDKVENVENKIKKAAEDLKKELHKDIKDL